MRMCLIVLEDAKFVHIMSLVKKPAGILKRNTNNRKE